MLKDWMFPPNIGNKRRMAAFFSSIIMDILGSVIRQEKEIKDI